MKRIILSLLLIISISLTSFSQYSQVESYIGEIRLFAGSFPPTGWAFCNGQTLQVQQYTAMFTILGTTYGGDGATTFGLPDLRGRVPVHSGNSIGVGLSPVVLGQKGGVETNFVNPPLVSVTTNGVKLDALTTGRDGVPTLVTSVVVNNGTTPQKLDNRLPYLGLNYIICLNGIFPMRD